MSTTGQFRKFKLKKLSNMLKDTGSAGSAGGHSPYNSPDGPKNGPSTQGLHPVNRFRVPVDAEARKTNGTSGQNSTVSSASAALQSSLASKLAAKMDLNGSMEYRLTWKNSVMPSGRVICRLRASGRPTSGKECSGWPTPNTPSGGPNSKSTPTHQGGMDLEGAAKLAGWPTAAARDWKSGASNQHGKNARPLNEVAKLAGWTTPQVHDTHPRGAGNRNNPKGGNACLAWDARGAITTSSPAGTENRGALNPAHSRWLMGYPVEWDSCGATAMQSCRKSRRGSSKP